MAGAEIALDLRQLSKLQRGILSLDLARRDDLFDAVGAELEDQARERIDETKQSPEGEAWAEWSESYAQTRESRHSLLVARDKVATGLLDSIHHQVEPSGVRVGSNLIYAATHQYGDEEREIPARPYLGFSVEGIESIRAVVEDYMSGQLSLLGGGGF